MTLACPLRCRATYLDRQVQNGCLGRPGRSTTRSMMTEALITSDDKNAVRYSSTSLPIALIIVFELSA